MGHRYRQSQDCTEFAIKRSWTFSRFTRRIWQDFAAFGRGLIPSPIDMALDSLEKAIDIDARCLRKVMADDTAEMDAAKREGRKPHILLPMFRPTADNMVKEAYRQAGRYLSAESPELSELINSIEGGAYLFYLLLKPKHPDVTEDDAYDVYWDLERNAGEDGRKTVQDIIQTCNGTAPETVKNDSPPAA